MKAPVITIDGPSGTGKGSICALLANALGWHLLDSGAVYRAAGWAALHFKVSVSDETELLKLLARTSIKMEVVTPSEPVKVWCDEIEITSGIRTEQVGMAASRVSAFAGVRQALLVNQVQFRQLPGLIADGRDMGTVVFPDADLKLYLDASTQIRAERRYNQLKEKGLSVDLKQVAADIETRDSQDTQRAVAPLRPAEDAHLIDTSDFSLEQVFAKVMAYVREFVL